MSIERPKNTKKSGLIEFFGYSSGNKFTGVCLTFDIIEEGKNPEEVMRSVEEAAILHLRTVCEKNLSDKLLNRYAPKEFWGKYFDFQKSIQEEKLLRARLESAKQVQYNPKSLLAMGLCFA